MWRYSAYALSACATAGIGYLGTTIYIENKYSALIDDNDLFMIYSPNAKIDISSKLANLTIPLINTNYYDPNKSGFKIDGGKIGLSIVRKDIDGKYYYTSAIDGQRIEKWIDFYLKPYKTVSSRDELLKLMKERKSDAYSESFVLVYAPIDDKVREGYLNKAVVHLLYKESPNKYLASSLKNNFHVIRVTDKQLASELKLDGDNPAFVKILDPRNLLSTYKRRSDYQSPEETKEYIDQNVATKFRSCGHRFQLDNKLFFDRFEFGNTFELDEGKFDNWDDLFSHMMSMNPFIIPVFNLKQLYMNGGKIQGLANEENKKILLVSLKQSDTERNVDKALSWIQESGIEKYLLKNPNVTCIIGYPEYFHNVPIHNLAVYHDEELEVRLMTVSKGYVTNSLNLDPKKTVQDLQSLSEQEEPKGHESSPQKPDQNSEILSAATFSKKILDDTSRCAFVMNCSKTCPACVYCEKFFQEAALQSTRCTFYKYYISNNNPRFRGPNSTPRFYMYKPGTTEPIEYEQRKHGLEPKNFLEFIDKNLDG